MASVATCWLEWRGEDIRCGACAGVLAVVWEGGMKAGVVAHVHSTGLGMKGAEAGWGGQACKSLNSALNHQSSLGPGLPASIL